MNKRLTLSTNALSFTRNECGRVWSRCGPLLSLAHKLAQNGDQESSSLSRTSLCCSYNIMALQYGRDCILLNGCGNGIVCHETLVSKACFMGSEILLTSQLNILKHYWMETGILEAAERRELDSSLLSDLERLDFLELDSSFNVVLATEELFLKSLETWSNITIFIVPFINRSLMKSAKCTMVEGKFGTP